MNFLKKIRLLGLKYFIDNFAYKIFYKMGFSSSNTVFLSLNLNDSSVNLSQPDAGLRVVKLTLEYLSSLKKILIFGDVLVDDLFNNDTKGAFIALNKYDEVVAFSFYDLSDQHTVNGWVSIEISEDLAWVGPVFVHPKYRGNKLNKHLYFAIFEFLSGERQRFITCINSNNQASIKSHKSMGFVNIGEVVRSNKKQSEVFSYKLEFKNIVKIL